MFEVGYVGSRGRQLVVLVDVNQAPAQLGVTNPNVNRPFFARQSARSAAWRSRRARERLTITACSGALGPTLLWGHLALGVLYASARQSTWSSDTDGVASFPNSYDLALQPRAGQLRCHGTSSRRPPSTRCRSRATVCWAAGR